MEDLTKSEKSPSSPTTPKSYPSSPTTPKSYPSSPTTPKRYPSSPTPPKRYPRSPTTPKRVTSPSIPVTTSVSPVTTPNPGYSGNEELMEDDQSGLCGMGNLLKVLYNRDDSPTKVDIFVDFENAEPTDRERPVWVDVDRVLKYANDILHGLQQYKGASNEIREAISAPNSEIHQQKAWEAVIPSVSALKRYYQFSLALEAVVPQLLRELCSNDMTAKEHLETQQALFKQFAEILDFVLKFDDLKMTNPAIQNDFSYYRRTLSRMKMANADIESTLEVNNETANKMSLFYAHATPMLRTLSDTTSKFVSVNKDLPVENTTDCLSTMANICRVMIENPNYRTKFRNEETEMFCLRVMVGVIILYDHVHPIGAFAKASNIDVKSSIKVLKDQDGGKVEGLLNALRYTTKHLNDEATPKAIKSLLA